MTKQKANSREEAFNCIKFAVENSTEKVKLPLMLWGHHGIGKTEIVKQSAEELGYNLVVLHLATQDIIDLIGRPITKKSKCGTDVQEWATPSWLQNALDNTALTGKPNIFFLDEFNRGPRLVLASMLPFLIEGIMHTHKIGPKDAVIAAANPATEDYEVNELTDKALLDRLGHVILKPKNEEYIKYLANIGMDQWTKLIVKENPEFCKIPDVELSFEVTPSRRSIVNVMSVIGKKDKAWIKKNASTVIEAYLGEDFKNKWIEAYATGAKSITLDMIKNYSTYKEEIEEILTTTIEGQKTVRMDILTRCIDILKQHIEDNNTVSETDIDYIINFFDTEIIPVDSAESFFSTNKTIRNSMLELPINIKLGEFLSRKKIFSNDGVDYNGV